MFVLAKQRCDNDGMLQN